jgi:prolyl-tRNA synthetase
LLRAKEFMMKDLYTFDSNSPAALETYEAVRSAYTAIFDALKLPYLVADADSGNMGGKLSHEYHFVSPKGEDNVWSCDSCDYIANEELVSKRIIEDEDDDAYPLVFRGISTDRKTEINIYVPAAPDLSSEEEPSWDSIASFVNLHAVKRALPSDINLDTGIEATTLNELLNSSKKPTTSISIVDSQLDISDDTEPSTIIEASDLTPTVPGSSCPRCSNGHLNVQKAIEVAHTFHLGTRYSDPLGAIVSLPDGKTRGAMQMGCHGIGVSRLIGAIASLLSDEKGLNWPRVIAPYETVILTSPQVEESEAVEVYDAISGNGNAEIDAVLDDREGKSLGWKLRDADLIGYPVIVVMGRGWKERKEVEVQCRRLGVKKEVGLDGVRGEVLGLLERL